MRTTATIISAATAMLLVTLGLAGAAFAQGVEDCYPVPADGCPPSDEDEGVDEGDEDLDLVGEPDEDAEDGAGEGEVTTAGGQPTGVLAQTGVPAFVLFAVVLVTLGAGAVLLVTTRRKSP